MNEKLQIVNPHASRGIKIVSSAVEVLEHLEKTLDNLDPVPSTAPTVGAIADAEVERMISEGGPTVPSGTLDAMPDPEMYAGHRRSVADGDPSVEAIEAPATDDAGSLAEIGRE
jgi:hypothetical protein